MVAAVDIAIFAVVALFAYVGSRRGLVSEVLSLVFLVLAVMTPLLFADNVMDLFYSPASDAIDDFYRKAIYVAVFALMFIGVLAIGSFTRMAAEHVSADGFKVLNYIFGGVFGFLRGVFVCVALIALADLLLPHSGFWEYDSKLVPALLPVSNHLSEWFPIEYFRNDLVEEF